MLHVFSPSESPSAVIEQDTDQPFFQCHCPGVLPATTDSPRNRDLQNQFCTFHKGRSCGLELEFVIRHEIGASGDIDDGRRQKFRLLHTESIFKIN
jgi:hypothetical protein